MKRLKIIHSYFCGVIAFVLLGINSIAQSNGLQTQMINSNNSVLEMESEVVGDKNVESKKRKIGELIVRLKERNKNLKKTMAENPDLFFQYVFSDDLLLRIKNQSSEAQQYTEQRVQLKGNLEIIIEDYEMENKAIRKVILHQPDKKTKQLFFKSNIFNVHQFAGKNVKIEGYQVDEYVAADRMLEDSVQSQSTNDQEANVCGPTGSQKVLAIIVNLPDFSVGTGMNHDFVRGSLLGNDYSAIKEPEDRNLNDYWKKRSKDKTWIDDVATKVIGPVSVTKNYNVDSNSRQFCDYYGISNEALKIVAATEDLTLYNRFLIIMPSNGACTWAGIANQGCRIFPSDDGTLQASVAWTRSSVMTSRRKAVQLFAHELGHNLGMDHASSRDFGSEALGNFGVIGSLSEYGDSFSSMGNANDGFYSASQISSVMNWSESAVDYLQVNTSGTYSIIAQDTPASGLKALKIQRGEASNNSFLWVEAPRNLGLYKVNSSVTNGALIRYQDDRTGFHSHLLDFTPDSSNGFSDAALPLNANWKDPYSNLELTVSQANPEGLVLIVNYGAPVCSKSNPTIGTNDIALAVNPGQTKTTIVNVKNNNTSVCNPSSYNLTSILPTGWSGNYSESSLTITSGSMGQSIFSFNVPSTASVGTYTVKFKATDQADSNLSHIGNLTVSVVAPVPDNYNLNLNLIEKGTVSFNNPIKSCNASCVTNYNTTSPVVLTATPDRGYEFVKWSGACSGSNPVCNIEVNSNMDVIAEFAVAGTDGEATFSSTSPKPSIGCGSIGKSGSPPGQNAPWASLLFFIPFLIVLIMRFKPVPLA